MFFGDRDPWPHCFNIVEIKDFTAQNCVLSRIVTSNIFPIGHASDIGVDRAHLLYALINDVSVDFGSHFCRVVVEIFQ